MMLLNNFFSWKGKLYHMIARHLWTKTKRSQLLFSNQSDVKHDIYRHLNRNPVVLRFRGQTSSRSGMWRHRFQRHRRFLAGPGLRLRPASHRTVTRLVSALSCSRTSRLFGAKELRSSCASERRGRMENLSQRWLALCLDVVCGGNDGEIICL